AAAVSPGSSFPQAAIAPRHNATAVAYRILPSRTPGTRTNPRAEEGAWASLTQGREERTRQAGALAVGNQRPMQPGLGSLGGGKQVRPWSMIIPALYRGASRSGQTTYYTTA